MEIENIPAFVRAIGFALLLLEVLLALVFVRRYRFLFASLLGYVGAVILFYLVRQSGDVSFTAILQDILVTGTELGIVLAGGLALYLYLKNGRPLKDK